MEEQPDTSIVIASFSSIQHLDKCLTSLKAHAKGVNVIVSTIFTAEQLAPLQQRFNFKIVLNPDEQYLQSARLRETRVFRLRTRGVQAAEGEKIILLEDHCEVTPKWLDSLQATLKNQQCIAGGSVTNRADSSLYSWALYWSEYAAMMPPLPTKGLTYLSAVNCGYFKTALDACKSVWQAGFYDNEVHDALIKQGAKYCPATHATVYTSLPFSFNQALVHLYTGGKRYGSYRGGSQWTIQRAIRVLSTLAVPAVLLARVFKLIRSRQPQQIKTFVFAWPVLYLLLGAWGLGELSGTLKGIKKKY